MMTGGEDKKINQVKQSDSGKRQKNRQRVEGERDIQISTISVLAQQKQCQRNWTIF